MITLMVRLDHLPAELEDLFRHTLGRVDMFHRKATAQTFQEALQATEDLPLIAYSFLDETDADFALKLATQEMNQIELRSRHASMARRLNGRLKGLLEVYVESSGSAFWGTRFDCLHRTVRDSLRSRDVLRRYLEEEPFNANTSLCRNCLALIKTMPVHDVKEGDILLII